MRRKDDGFLWNMCFQSWIIWRRRIKSMKSMVRPLQRKSSSILMERASFMTTFGNIVMPDTAAAMQLWPTGIPRISSLWFTKATFTAFPRYEMVGRCAWANV
eukprot:symbB.v1.2.003625.t1/scaffold203.1/size271217/17